MSIIEKAAHRIDRERKDTTVHVAPVATELQAVKAEVVTSYNQTSPVTSPVPTQAAAGQVDVTGIAAAMDKASEPPTAPAGKPRSNALRIDLDLAKMRQMGLVTAAGGRTNLLEEFRVIKRPLLKRAFGERSKGEMPPNLIMVTSSLPGEGKTYCAINLAMSIAMELDHTVLLVDADVARPSVLRTLDQPAQPGLMDILVDDKLDLGDVILRTNVDTLSILPAGTSTPRATELLASSTMNGILHELANRYPDRVIVFDSPPLLLTSESRVLASHMGQIVVVVEAQTTTQHAVKEALHKLDGIKNINIIYNKTRDIPGIEETYDYHYG